MKKLLTLGVIGVLAAAGTGLLAGQPGRCYESTLPSAQGWEAIADSLRECFALLTDGVSVTPLPDDEGPRIIIRLA